MVKKMNKNASFLFVPAIDNMIAKAFDYAADSVIFDIEDSIKQEEKDAALSRLIDHLTVLDVSERPNVYVRLNADRLSSEIEKIKLASSNIDGIVIPKAEEAVSINRLDYNGEVLALIETPIGMINLPEIAAESSVSTILFGAEDYTSITGMLNESSLLIPLKLDIVKYARANGKRCVDTICKDYKDKDAIRESAIQSKQLGFDGKLLIHPVQVAIANEVFDVEDIERKKRILEAFDRCPDGVLKFEGEIYELPHIEMIRREINQYGQK